MGDKVKTGQVLAYVEDDLLTGAVNQAKAEKMAQRSGVLTAKSQVGDRFLSSGKRRSHFIRESDPGQTHFVF